MEKEEKIELGSSEEVGLERASTKSGKKPNESMKWRQRQLGEGL